MGVCHSKQKQTGMDLSNSLTYDKLWNLIPKCDVPMLKTLLAKGKIPVGNAQKENLQNRLYYAIRLGEKSATFKKKVSTKKCKC